MKPCRAFWGSSGTEKRYAYFAMTARRLTPEGYSRYPRASATKPARKRRLPLSPQNARHISPPFSLKSSFPLISALSGFKFHPLDLHSLSGDAGSSFLTPLHPFPLPFRFQVSPFTLSYSPSSFPSSFQVSSFTLHPFSSPSSLHLPVLPVNLFLIP